ncbi:hypothetical protein Gotri_021308 [Gossypium trilobum]|uniref:Thymidylate kinase-like domain-containing protein n=5 Tax=Gossypium TaxID=3633 RepID=A0A7J9DC48_9ROSI|nr:hypothetical protein [Gossypium davidsonii]MBA0669692.1 hypothetical protein [Gossypium klotzschianum]MBA0758299.1 hypothetical protein [Gossypium trilobum]
MMETKLKAGTTLIVDRYSYFGVSFSSATGLDFEWCKAPENGLIAPNLVVYLDIPPEKAAEKRRLWRNSVMTCQKGKPLSSLSSC